MKTEKKHVTDSNLAITEKWLREQSKLGWKLTDVKSGLFFCKFTFVKSNSRDNVYFAPASHLGYKLFKLQKSYYFESNGELNYIKNNYGGKLVSKSDLNGWIAFKRSKITNPEDVKKNLMYREKYIRNCYLLYLISFFTISVLTAAAIFFSPTDTYFYSYSMSIILAFISMFFALKFFIHRKNCKIAYSDFLNE